MKKKPEMVTFIVDGVPAPWTSPRRGQRGGCIQTPAVLRMKAWQERVRLAATAAMRGNKMLDGPVNLSVTFTPDHATVVAAKIAQGGEPDWATKKPDLTNLVKATEDALSGIVFEDDAQVAYLCAFKFRGVK